MQIARANDDNLMRDIGVRRGGAIFGRGELPVASIWMGVPPTYNINYGY